MQLRNVTIAGLPYERKSAFYMSLLEKCNLQYSLAWIENPCKYMQFYCVQIDFVEKKTLPLIDINDLFSKI